MKKVIKWGAIGFVILIVIGIVGSSSSSKPQKVGTTDTSAPIQLNTQTPAAIPQVFKMGDKVNLDGRTVTINSVKPYTSKNQFMQPKNGNKYVAVDITLKNDSNGAFNYSSLEFNLQDNQDYKYSGALSDIEPSLGTGAVQPGQTTRGFIAFEIPGDNQPARVIYTPSIFGTSQIIIELK